jgi:hypothetical protein
LNSISEERKPLYEQAFFALTGLSPVVTLPAPQPGIPRPWEIAN